MTNPPNTSTSWTSFSVWLDTRSEWKDASTGMLATEADIRSALTNLKTLRLPGEWRDGAETTCIDNIYFGIP